MRKETLDAKPHRMYVMGLWGWWEVSLWERGKTGRLGMQMDQVSRWLPGFSAQRDLSHAQSAQVSTGLSRCRVRDMHIHVHAPFARL